jgi:16S rRNA G966 N2-methylase RsmD
MSDEQPYQVMPDLDAEKYERLKQDIANNGIEYPIILDGDGEIIDGHHRYEAWVDLDRDPDDLPTRVVDDTSSDNYHRAYRANLLRRDLSDGTKRDVVKQYLLEHPDRVAEDTQEAIAEDLGVSQWTVSQALDEIDVKDIGANKLTTDEKREQVRTYVEDNPNASNREVSREVDCDVTHVTVGNWRDEWEIQEPSTGLDTYTNTKSEADDALDVVDTATDETADEEVRETAQENADRLSEGKTTPSTASKNTEKAEAKQQVKDDQDTDTTEAKITNSDAIDYMQSISEPVDLLLTDPPYSTDVNDITAFAKSWIPTALETIASDGFAFICVGAYPDELQAYLNVIDTSTDWTVQQVMVWTYRNTLGRAPNNEYKLNWQAILFLRGEDAPELDVAKTSEQWAVQDINAPDARHGDRHHQWEKPTELANRLIRHTTEEGDTVLDPFAGTGTFPLTTANLGRNVLACDKDKEMLEIAKERGCVIDE